MTAFETFEDTIQPDEITVSTDTGIFTLGSEAATYVIKGFERRDSYHKDPVWIERTGYEAPDYGTPVITQVEAGCLSMNSAAVAQAIDALSIESATLDKIRAQSGEPDFSVFFQRDLRVTLFDMLSEYLTNKPEITECERRQLGAMALGSAKELEVAST